MTNEDRERRERRRELTHSWHGAINQFIHPPEAKHDHEHWKKNRSMYWAKTAFGEVERLPMLFEMERTGKLAKTHKACAHCGPPPQEVQDNHLTCCLGVECRACPMLVALDSVDCTDEERDQIKAWTCIAHILSSGGDVANEGFILTTDDRMYWDSVHQSLASADQL